MTEIRLASMGLSGVYEKACAGERLSLEEGEQLFACRDPHVLFALADMARRRRHGNAAHYVRNRHVNYTNVCVQRCSFCAFRRKEGEQGAFTLSHEDVVARLEAPEALGADEAHIVGGCHPSLPLSWYEELLGLLREKFPGLVLKGFTMVEIAHFAALEGLETREVLQRLKDAGLAMLPGGGAEIFAPAVRREICPTKISGQEWLRIAGEAHELGLKSNCTMLFGHLESLGHRLEHLDALRRQQDASGGFVCFIPLPFLTKNNPLAQGRSLPPTSTRGLDILRTIAVSRLLLDNIPHIKAYWAMLGFKTALAALHCGADDIDGTIVEEHIGHMAGADSDQAVDVETLEHALRDSGFTPVRRDGLFRHLEPAGGGAPAGRMPFGLPTEGASAAELLRAAAKGRRLDRDEALALWMRAPLHDLCRAAHELRQRCAPADQVTYVVDRNVNYTDVCVCGCRFCAFHVAPGQGGYVLDEEELARKVEETFALGGEQILLQGGCHPELGLDFYEGMLAGLKRRFPRLHLHAFSPPEIWHMARQAGLEVAEVIARLHAAGLDSIPGGGAEILVDRVRARVSPGKCTAGQWLEVMRQAHAQGLRTTATMMYGHEETLAERLEHLFVLRDLQDETGGFTAFIPWAFQPQNTAIERRPEPPATYLRLLALSRLVLDNVANIQASWVTMGPHLAQMALHCGANDFGSTMIEENVVAAAGVKFRMDEAELRDIVAAAGFAPVRRTMDYSPWKERTDAADA